ncbi:MAG: bacillithiol biosynthesis cysteine-adding enzyme BshC [Gemmatimonadales bacterium]
MRVISTPIVGTGLTRIGVDKAGASPWFEPIPADASAWKRRAELIRSSLVTKNWLATLAPGFNATGAAAERLQRAADRGFVVTAGQQPGLFGGPLYTWWKALSALSLANRLESETGLPVAPVFWAATDDSDYAEAAGTVVATNTGSSRLSLPALDGSGRALADVPLGDVSALLDLLVAASGSAPNAAALKLVKQAYSPDHTVGSAYVDLLRSILEPLGISVLDAAHPSVRAAAFPVLKLALTKSQAIEDSLIARSAELKEKNLSPQVKIVKARSLVFEAADGERDRVRIKDVANVVARAKNGDLGPNVLLRPIVERSILPTVAYIGGPAEVAYFAQVTAVADAMKSPRPVIVPRWSGMIVESRIQGILDRYSLSVEDFRDPHAPETRMARESLPPGLMNRFTELRASIESSVASLSAADQAGIVPSAVIDGLKRNIAHRVDRLERRYIAAVKRSGNETLREIAIARGALFPDGAPQERALNFIPFLARFGDEIVDSVTAEIDKHFASI